jgi:CRP-like cAMP-binding protein
MGLANAISLHLSFAHRLLLTAASRGTFCGLGDGFLSSIHVWIASLDVRDIFGTVGVIGYVGAYLALQLGLLKGDGYMFPALNLAASLSVLISLTRDFNPFSTTIEICWITISIIGISRIYLVQRFIKLSEEEAEVARRIVPSLKKDRARRFLRLGRFVDVPVDYVLTTQGQPVVDVAMVMNGICHIERGATHIASISAGALVGELTLSTGAPATATVRAVEPSRLFLIDRKALLGFLQRNPEALADMERSIAGDLRLKLTNTTTKLSSYMGGRGSNSD